MQKKHSGSVLPLSQNTSDMYSTVYQALRFYASTFSQLCSPVFIHVAENQCCSRRLFVLFALLILLALQSRSGDKTFEFKAVFPQHGTAVLKGITTPRRVETPSDAYVYGEVSTRYFQSHHDSALCVPSLLFLQKIGWKTRPRGCVILSPV